MILIEIEEACNNIGISRREAGMGGHLKTQVVGAQQHTVV